MLILPTNVLKIHFLWGTQYNIIVDTSLAC